MNKKLTYISLFSGAGGLDIGLDRAGFKRRACVEKDLACRATLKLNNRKVRLADEGDVFSLGSSDLARLAGLRRRELFLLAGGPPCQPFSKSGFWANGETDRMNDPRAGTLKEYMRIVNDLLPQNILLENVSGISYSNKDDGIRYIKRRFSAINKKHNVSYLPSVIELNAADYGVPQIRKRVFVVANINGKEFTQPTKTHCPIDSEEVGRLPVYNNAWDAIGDIDVDIWPAELAVKGKWGGLLPSIPEGQNYLWHTDRMGGQPIFGWRTRYWSFLLKLSKNKPSWTITASPGPAIGPFHWKNRRLSTRELARLQTFPDDYDFCGSDREIQSQIGNAVPCAIGELLGLEIRRQILGQRVRRKLTLIPIKADSVPKEERVKPIQKKYKKYIGEHDEHPGTGKGPGAKQAVTR